MKRELKQTANPLKELLIIIPPIIIYIIFLFINKKEPKFLIYYITISILEPLLDYEPELLFCNCCFTSSFSLT